MSNQMHTPNSFGNAADEVAILYLTLNIERLSECQVAHDIHDAIRQEICHILAGGPALSLAISTMRCAPLKGLNQIVDMRRHTSP